jgi:hypothetical protein
MRLASRERRRGDGLQDHLDVSRTNIFERNRDQPAPGICSILLVQVQGRAASHSNLAPADGFLQGARRNPSIAVKGLYGRVLIEIDAN